MSDIDTRLDDKIDALETEREQLRGREAGMTTPSSGPGWRRSAWSSTGCSTGAASATR